MQTAANNKSQPIRGALARKLVFGLGLALLPLEGWAASAVSLSADPVVVGQVAILEVSLQVGTGENLSAVSVDVSFDSSVLDPSLGCVIDPNIGAGTLADKSLEQSVPQPGLLRVAVLGLNTTAIPSGPLFECDLQTDALGPPGSYPLGSSAMASTTEGASAPLTGGSTELAITTGNGTSGLCGDVNDSGVVDGIDVDIMRDALTGSASALTAPDQCSVTGGLMDCDMVDVVVLRRHLEAAMAPGPSPVCSAAQP
jgi:hypothetical protein